MDPIVAAEQRRARGALSSVLGVEYHLDVLDLGVDSAERRGRRVEKRRRASGTAIDAPVQKKGRPRRRGQQSLPSRPGRTPQEHVAREARSDGSEGQPGHHAGTGGGSTALYLR